MPKLNNFERHALRFDLNWNTSIERMVYVEMRETRETGRELLRVIEKLKQTV